jgi:hypothetical protein
MSKQKIDAYKVWLHIEAVTEDGDVVRGDEYYEPHEAGSFNDEASAEALRDRLENAASVGWTVILSYPDYLADCNGDFFMAWSDKEDSAEAISEVRRKAAQTQCVIHPNMDPDDFGLVGVIQGHHALYNSEN